MFGTRQVAEQHPAVLHAVPMVCAMCFPYLLVLCVSGHADLNFDPTRAPFILHTSMDRGYLFLSCYTLWPFLTEASQTCRIWDVISAVHTKVRTAAGSGSWSSVEVVVCDHERIAERAL